MKAIELKPIRKGNNCKFHLYINGKTDRKEYEKCKDGIIYAEFQGENKLPLDKVKNIQCSEFPEKLNIHFHPKIKMKVGETGCVYLKREIKKFEIMFGFTLADKEKESMICNYALFMNEVVILAEKKR